MFGASGVKTSKPSTALTASALLGNGSASSPAKKSSPYPLQSSSPSATVFGGIQKQSNLVVRGVVASLRRELVPIATVSSTALSGQQGGDNHDGAEDAAGAAHEMDHVATFILDASEGAAANVANGHHTAAPYQGGPPSRNASPRPPANTVTLRLSGDWALSTSFVGVGDIIEISKFDVDTTGGISSLSASRAPGAAGTTFASSATSPTASPALLASAASLVIAANNCTELSVTRMKHIHINTTNVGQMEYLELTDREQAEARHAFSNVPPQRFGDKNMFSQVGAYYDIIKGQSDLINPQMAFLQSLFGFRTNILDAGCGSGLYSFAFRGYGVYPVCVDASHAMQRRFEEKNRFFQLAEAQQKHQQHSNKTGGNPNFNQQQLFSEGGSGADDASVNSGAPNSPSFMGGSTEPNTTRSTLMARKAQKALALRGTSELAFYLADLASFSLARRDVDGNVRYTEFEGVLCLDVLALLPDIDAVRAALSNLSLHTGKGGIAVVSFPNSTVVLEKGCHMNTMAYEVDRFKLSVGAVSAPQGTLHLTETIFIEMPNTADRLFRGSAGLASLGASAANSPNQTGHYNATTASTANNTPFSGASSGNNTTLLRQQQASLLQALPKRITTWKGTAFHPTAMGAGDKFVSFVDTFAELLMPAGLIEQLFGECGYVVKALYGSLTGDAFTELVSDNRYYVLQRL